MAKLGELRNRRTSEPRSFGTSEPRRFRTLEPANFSPQITQVLKYSGTEEFV